MEMYISPFLNFNLYFFHKSGLSPIVSVGQSKKTIYICHVKITNCQMDEDSRKYNNSNIFDL